jgi:hypothetical protein
MNRISIFLLLVLAIVSTSLFAQTAKYSNEFLNIGVGARGLAMSKAQVASVNDVTAAYWNPAGITGIENNLQIAAQHAEYFAGIAKYDYGALATRIDDKSNLAFTFLRFGVDDIPNTTELIDQNGQVNYDRITTFSAADYAFMASYGRKINDKLSIGGNAKVIYRQVGDMAHAWGFGVDFGAQDGLEVTLPRLSIGAARKFVIKDKFSILTELNADITTDGKRNVLISGDPVSIDPNLGVEFSYNNIFYLRGGIGNLQRIKAEIGDYYEYTFQPNIGVGLTIKETLSIDYALTDIGDQSVALYSNVFSLRVAINKKS